MPGLINYFIKLYIGTGVYISFVSFASKEYSHTVLKMEEGELADESGRKIATYTWTPEGEVRALVFLCHG